MVNTLYMKLTISLALTLSCMAAYGSWCLSWKPPQPLGILPKDPLDEVSGLAISSKYKKIYHVNDSGSGPYFYSSDLKGAQVKKISIENASFTDIEALSLGPCMGDTCVFIADIGDNLALRPSVKIYVLKESDFEGKVKTFKTLEFTYPDGRHNAEGMAVHPSGDIFIATKDYDTLKRKELPSRFYKIPYSDWQNQDHPKPLYIGQVDVTVLQNAKDYYQDLITGLDISSAGNRFLAMTYWDAFEFKIDLSKATSETFSKMTKADYKQIALKHLAQQESIAYLPDIYGFVYTTEYKKKYPIDLIKMSCARETEEITTKDSDDLSPIRYSVL